jgi:hypothetical protein
MHIINLAPVIWECDSKGFSLTVETLRPVWVHASKTRQRAALAEN